ncbi:phytanoyl-CoA dioxygenase family protein [Psychrobium sp. nBUS_13]|uniref:phytanoyl-CoA dioxygenase family protein n=1 Tax=Psychrobium sp. nBUS_13 TaxID=3395319 RepID=UPI003EBA90EB
MYILIKELGESLLRNIRLLGASKPSPQYINNIEALRRDGISVIPKFLSRKTCEEMIGKIDSYVESDAVNVWRDDEGADNRIFFINELDESFSEFYENKEIRNYLSSYLGISNPKGMLLAAKITFTEDNKGSGGGWHRDSPVSHQFKSVCYLNDVGTKNGCFQFIKSSHLKSNVLSSYFYKIFKPGQFRFSESDVNNYLLHNKSKVDSIEGSAGDLVLVDTKGIHRGRPLEGGVRYALFCYFWNNKIPDHFLNLRQK